MSKQSAGLIGYLQVVVVEVALGGLAGDLVFMMRLDNSVEEVTEQNVGLGVARDTPHRYRTRPITFTDQHDSDGRPPKVKG